MRVMRSCVMCVAAALLVGCSTSRPEATSLLGDELYPPHLEPDVHADRTAKLDAARAAVEADPDSEDALIWYGRRLAYLGRYNDAIEVYTTGLERWPGSYRLLRHRGHRWITVRAFDNAVDDLSRAAELVEGVPDEVEPDGLPNALNIPTSTTQTNIFYHLGLAHYLLGEYDSALDAYERCMERSKNDDMRCAAAYWRYLTLMKLGREDDAQASIAFVREDVEIIENTDYHRLLLMYKGELAVEDVASDAQGAIASSTVAYGIACRYWFDGDRDEAVNWYGRGLAGSWPAFGSIACEAELARLGY